MIRLGIVGTGGMANFHASEFAKVKGCKVTAVCDVDAARAQAFADKYNVKKAYSDFAGMLAGTEVDAVSIVTPDAFHAPLSLQAIAAGKHVLCEKPLATSYKDAAKMAAAAEKAGVINMVNFSYRNSAAIQKARELAVDKGVLGEIIHVEASYLQSWLSSKVWGDWRTTPAWLWRLSTKHGSLGVLGDIGVHILDLASYPAGDFRSVNARLKTFSAVKGKKMGDYPLDANDSAVITAEFANGALATIHTSRWATGHKNTLLLRIFGEKGAIVVDLDKSYTQLQICIGASVDKAEWETIDCPPTPSNIERFIKSIRTGKNDQPDFKRGAAIQKVIDACFKSDATGRAVRV